MIGLVWIVCSLLTPLVGYAVDILGKRAFAVWIKIKFI
jgi:hypothetical protein